MFSDRFFYPLALLVIAAMIGGALAAGGPQESLDEARILSEGWQVSGLDLEALTVAPGSEGDYVDEDGGYLRLSQFTPWGVGPASPGVFGTLTTEYEQAFAGRSLRIQIRARSSRTNGLESFHTAYFPMEGVARSPWHEFDLTPDWQDFSFEFAPPIADAPENVDLIAIFPGREGESKGVDVASIRIEVLAPEA